jgi:hypothetical protein
VPVEPTGTEPWSIDKELIVNIPVGPNKSTIVPFNATEGLLFTFASVRMLNVPETAPGTLDATFTEMVQLPPAATEVPQSDVRVKGA